MWLAKIELPNFVPIEDHLLPLYDIFKILINDHLRVSKDFILINILVLMNLISST